MEVIHGLDSIKGEFDIPNIAYTPYAIFSGQIPLLDINFISPVNQEKIYSVKLRSGEKLYITANNKEEVLEKVKDVKVIENDGDVVVNIPSSEIGTWMQGVQNAMYDLESQKAKISDNEYNQIKENANNLINKISINDWISQDEQTYYEKKICSTYDEFIGLREKMDPSSMMFDATSGLCEWESIVDAQTLSRAFQKFWDDLDKIASDNNLTGMASEGNAHYFGENVGNNDENIQIDSNDILSIDEGNVSSAQVLHDIIAAWYVTLRTISLVGLLTVLVYIGIRILLSSVAEDKAKYKKLLMDWIVALCLIFVLHYIMSFTLKITSKLVEIFNNNSTEDILCELPIGISADMDGDGHKKDLKKGFIYGITDGTTASGLEKIKREDVPNSEIGIERPYLLSNFVGYLRIGVNLYDVDGKQALGSLIMYTVIVIYTVVFTFQYLKRVFIMAFLTLIAPLVALTYPIDKVKDGSAQAFNFWLREYVFNALIQVIHLLIYTVVVSSVYELAIKHPIYALVALGCMIPMENLVRKMFGFEKAGTVSTLASAAGAGLIMNGLQSLTKGIGKGGTKPPAKGGNNSKDKMPNIWTNKNDDKLGLDDMLLGGEGENDLLSQGSNSMIKGANNILSNGVSSQSKQKSNSSKDPNYDLFKSVDHQKKNYDLFKPNTGYDLFKSTNSNKGPAFSEMLAKKDKDGKIGKRPIKLKGLKAGAKAVGSQFYRRNLQGRKPLRSIAKLGATGLGAAVGAGIGITAGIATGDLSKAATFAVGGATALGGVAGNLVENGYNATEDYADTFNDAYHYDDEEYWNRQRVKEFKSDSANMDELRNRYSAEEIKNIEKNIIPTVVGEHGINDINDIAAISDMVMKDGMDLEKSIAIAEASNGIGSLSSAKARKEAMDTFKENYANKLGLYQIQDEVQSRLASMQKPPEKPKDISPNANRKVRNKYKLDMKKYEAEKKAYDEQVAEINAPLKAKEDMVQNLAKQHLDMLRAYQKRKK